MKPTCWHHAPGHPASGAVKNAFLLFTSLGLGLWRQPWEADRASSTSHRRGTQPPLLDPRLLHLGCACDFQSSVTCGSSRGLTGQALMTPCHRWGDGGTGPGTDRCPPEPTWQEAACRPDSKSSHWVPGFLHL